MGEGRIAYGTVAAPGQFPFMARLAVIAEQSYTMCGGTVISPYHILTAGELYINIQTSSHSSITFSTCHFPPLKTNVFVCDMPFILQPIVSLTEPPSHLRRTHS